MNNLAVSHACACACARERTHTHTRTHARNGTKTEEQNERKKEEGKKLQTCSHIGKRIAIIITHLLVTEQANEKSN